MPDLWEVTVPELGKVDEITLIEWKVDVGDEVDEGTELAEIETMKSTFSVESRTTGTIEEILVQEGEKVGIDQTLATIREF